MNISYPAGLSEKVDRIVSKALEHPDPTNQGVLISRTFIERCLASDYQSMSRKALRRAISRYLNPLYPRLARHPKNVTWILKPVVSTDNFPVTTCAFCPDAIKGEGVPGLEMMICSRSGDTIHCFPIRPKGCPRVDDVQ